MGVLIRVKLSNLKGLRKSVLKLISLNSLSTNRGSLQRACVGCGRCINACPVGIDISSVINTQSPQ